MDRPCSSGQVGARGCSSYTRHRSIDRARLESLRIPVAGDNPLFVAPDDKSKVVARLPEELGLPGRLARDVRITYQTYEHIVSRRAADASWHVQFVLAKMPSVISAPHLAGRLHDDRRKVELFRWADGDPCGVLVSVKTLDLESWVNTAFPMGATSLQKHIRKGRLRSVEQARSWLFTDR